MPREARGNRDGSISRVREAARQMYRRVAMSSTTTTAAAGSSNSLAIDATKKRTTEWNSLPLLIKTRRRLCDPKENTSEMHFSRSSIRPDSLHVLGKSAWILA